MNRKRTAFLTSLTLLMISSINSHNPLKNVSTLEIQAKKTKNKLKLNKRYPSINDKLDVVSMDQYSNSILFMNVTLENFYIKSLIKNNDQSYSLLLTSIKTSNQYFFTTVYSIQGIKRNNYITIQGFLNGRTKIDQNKINFGLNSKYSEIKAISLLTDNIGSID